MHHNPLRVIEMLELRRFLNAGDLDPSFGTNGFLAAPMTATGDFDLEVNDSRIVAGDKILVAGKLGSTLLLQRYNRDGTLDDTFHADVPPIDAAESLQSITQIEVTDSGK